MKRFGERQMSVGKLWHRLAAVCLVSEDRTSSYTVWALAHAGDMNKVVNPLNWRKYLGKLKL